MVRLKRYAAPKTYPIAKKKRTWTVTPVPGPHAKTNCVPLLIILRDMLHYASTAREAKKILSSRKIMVDGIIRTDPRYPCGLMDVIRIPETKQMFRILPKASRLLLIPIKEDEAKVKLCQLKNKRIIEGGHVQLNLHDGRNIKIAVKDPKNPKEAKDYKTGDTLVISLPDQKILEHIPMEKGNIALVVAGRSTGAVGKIKEIILVRGREPNKILLEMNGKEVRTLRNYTFIVGKTKPIINMGEEK